jgi:hypothetical protein
MRAQLTVGASHPLAAYLHPHLAEGGGEQTPDLADREAASRRHYQRTMSTVSHSYSDDFAMTTDVVVGFGFAGAAAAITAREHGADVLVLEKLPQGGGNSRVSYGGTFVAHEGNKQSPTSSDGWTVCVVEPLRSMSSTPSSVAPGSYPTGSQGSAESWSTRAPHRSCTPTLGWCPAPIFPAIAPGRAMFDKLWADDQPGVPPSQRLWDLVSEGAVEAGAAVRCDAAVSDLLQDADGAIHGVLATVDGKPQRSRARRGVVMCSGGFITDETLRRQWLSTSAVRFAGSPGNTGDGVGITQRVGADLWHTTRTSTFVGFQSPEHDAAFCLFFHGPGFVWLDRAGRRFVDETSVEMHDLDRVLSHLDPDTLEHQRIPAWAVLDRATLDAGPLTWPIAGHNRDTYSWSADNSAEVAKGWIREAATIEDLAREIGVPEESLRRSLDDYNLGARTGRDAFGRRTETLTEITPPSYAIRLDPVALKPRRAPARRAGPRPRHRGCTDPRSLLRVGARIDLGARLPGRRQHHRGPDLRPTRGPWCGYGAHVDHHNGLLGAALVRFGVHEAVRSAGRADVRGLDPVGSQAREQGQAQRSRRV